MFEAETIGARSSGHTGGLALAETAAGDLPGLGDVLAERLGDSSRSEYLLRLGPSGRLRTRSNEQESQALPIHWTDTGELRVGKEVPGGSLDPGKLVSGLAQAAANRGVLIFEHSPVESVDFTDALDSSRRRTRRSRRPRAVRHELRISRTHATRSQGAAQADDGARDWPALRRKTCRPRIGRRQTLLHHGPPVSLGPSPSQESNHPWQRTG